MKIGYIRVSSADQNEARQIEALKGQGVDKMFIEKVSGKDMNRPELQKMLQFVREGDTIIIESISRLARNTLDFLTIVKELNERKIDIVSLKEMIDTSTPQGKFMLTVFGAMYEMERDTIKQRQAEGIEVAKMNGIKFGRPKLEINEEFVTIYHKWRIGEMTAEAAMKHLNMKRNTFYRRVKEYETA